jgi:chromosome segregation ATPase
MENIKNILIFALLAVCLVFGYMVLFSEDTGYAEKLKTLEDANVQLQGQRTAANKKIDSLNGEYARLKAHEGILIADIAQRDASIAQSAAIAARSQAELGKLKREMETTIRKIKDAKAHPANRTGDDLLNSLKLKTAK